MQKYLVRKEDVEERVAPGPNTRFARFLLDRDRIADAQLSAAVFRYEAGQVGPAHTHAEEAEIYFVLAGKGAVHMEGVEYALEKDTLLYIPPGAEHETRNTGQGEFEFLAVFAPPVGFGAMKEAWKERADED